MTEYPVIVVDGVPMAVPKDGVIYLGGPKTTGAVYPKAQTRTLNSVRVNPLINFVEIDSSILLTPEVIYMHEIVNLEMDAFRIWTSPLNTVFTEEGSNGDPNTWEMEWASSDIYMGIEGIDYDLLKRELDPNTFDRAGEIPDELWRRATVNMSTDMDSLLFNADFNVSNFREISESAGHYTYRVNGRDITIWCMVSGNSGPSNSNSDRYVMDAREIDLAPLVQFIVHMLENKLIKFHKKYACFQTYAL